MLDYRFNSVGDYTDMEPGPKNPGVFRIVMLGASVAMGANVPRAETFAVTLPKTLTDRTGKKVELYNRGIAKRTARVCALQMDDTLALKPDLILWIISPGDIRTAATLLTTDDVPDYMRSATAENRNAQVGVPVWKKLRTKFAQAILLFEHAVNERWRSTRSFVLLTDLMSATESESQFLARNRSIEQQYLGAVPSQARLDHLKDLDRYGGELIERAKSADVPVVAVYLPGTLAAAYVSNGSWPRDVDPFSLDNELRRIMASHGAIYVDVLPYFRSVRNPRRYFFPVDGHPNSDGHALISGLLAKELTSGKIPGLTPESAQSNWRTGNGRPD
jgi:hypothetical protein